MVNFCCKRDTKFKKAKIRESHVNLLINLAIFETKTFIILGILKTLEYFCRALLLRPFLMFGRILNTPVRQNVLLSLHSYYVLFHPYSETFKHYSRECSRIFKTLCISGIFKTLTCSYHKAYSDSKIYS